MRFPVRARMVQYHDQRQTGRCREIITVHWDGRLPEAREKIFIPMRRKKKYFLPVQGQQSTARKIIEKIGYFDEEHFAYLEDTDIGYRARIYGYENWYAPKAVVYHVGSGTSGSTI